MAGTLLQSLVTHHFRLACLEARRSADPVRSRYVWQLTGVTITVYMPNALSGRDRAAWLEANVDDPDPTRPGEQARVQAIVDRHLGVPRRFRLAEASVEATAVEASDVTALVQKEVTVTGLAEVVAREKAETIGRQRPAIRRLGPDRLADLVRRIFSAVSEGAYEEKALAERFGLSRPTFTRFAGSRWRSGKAGIPDLWRNVAHTLAGHKAFIETARQAGLWGAVETIVVEGESSDA